MPAFAAEIPLGPLNNPATGNKFGEDYVGLEKMVGNFIGVGTIVAGLALVGYFIYGAVQWSTAGGDKAGIEEAKKILTNAVIGLVIAASAMIIVSIIETILGIKIITLTPADWNKLFP
ncbi:MAG: hypothetical protein Q8N84_04415 [bacterium]|nr:hypothetical protein [bacterium]